MFTKTRIAIVALTVTGFALSAAGPANAIPSDHDTTAEVPVSERTIGHDNGPIGTKSCTVETTGPDGKKTIATYPPGSKLTVNGKTYECQDGTWVLTTPIDWIDPDAGYVYEADDAYLEDAVTLVFVNPHGDYSYSNDGGHSAAP